MKWILLKSKIHRARVTETNLHYEGSISIDKALMEASYLFPHEQVHVLNLSNGVRIETYVIPEKENSGIIGINGAAARFFYKGDPVIILSYAWMEPEEARAHEPTIVCVDEHNRIIKK